MAVKFELPFTQTSHVVAFVCALLLAVVLSPVGNVQLSKGEIVADLVRLIHLSSFATWLGVQVWVTFFAGIAFKYFVGSFFFSVSFPDRIFRARRKSSLGTRLFFFVLLVTGSWVWALEVD